MHTEGHILDHTMIEKAGRVNAKAMTREQSGPLSTNVGSRNTLTKIAPIIQQFCIFEADLIVIHAVRTRISCRCASGLGLKHKSDGSIPLLIPSKDGQAPLMPWFLVTQGLLHTSVVGCSVHSQMKKFSGFFTFPSHRQISSFLAASHINSRLSDIRAVPTILPSSHFWSKA